ncbi:MAG TPA: ribbon-helix-helix protein, CopG family [Anaerolineaceae bacterium]|nr:ribbon-helix-helix protein, CopG family [Anaerolineales bacterium]HIQ08045.1 ribbon-helix-helix protein, CopG family [Anaerolineaceae bacterium]
MVRRQVQLRDDQWRALRRLAAQRGLSVSELIRRSVDAWLRTQGAWEPVDRRQRALAVVGRFRSGRQDVAQRHDEHLAAILAHEGEPE